MRILCKIVIMLRATLPKHKNKSRRVKYVNIVADAAALGVERTHLYRVLVGKDRTSKSLLARYAALKSSQAKKAA